VEPAVPALEFMEEFSAALASSGCAGMFGLDTISRNSWAEMTVGNASVVVRSTGDEHEDFVSVALEFDSEQPRFRVHGKCKSNHKHTTKPATTK